MVVETNEMKQISINLPDGIIKDAEREASRTRRRPDGTVNTTAAVLRDWIMNGKPLQPNNHTPKMGATRYVPGILADEVL